MTHLHEAEYEQIDHFEPRWAESLQEDEIDRSFRRKAKVSAVCGAAALVILAGAVVGMAW